MVKRKSPRHGRDIDCNLFCVKLMEFAKFSDCVTQVAALKVLVDDMACSEAMIAN
jgi:hypothetical protein